MAQFFMLQFVDGAGVALGEVADVEPEVLCRHVAEEIAEQLLVVDVKLFHEGVELDPQCELQEQGITSPVTLTVVPGKPLRGDWADNEEEEEIIDASNVDSWRRRALARKAHVGPSRAALSCSSHRLP